MVQVKLFFFSLFISIWLSLSFLMVVVDGNGCENAGFIFLQEGVAL
jgi:hypothetical protein